MTLNSVLERSTELAVAAGFRRKPLDPELAQAEKPLPSGNLSCNAQSWEADAAELRVVSIESPKIQVISCFVYPHSAIALPLYAMELVQLGAKPIVAVIDAVAPAHDPAQAIAQNWLEQAHCVYADLKNADDPPPWFQACRSGLDFFIRPGDQTELRRVGSLHVELLGRYLHAIPDASQRTVAAAHRYEEFSRHYKDHHAANSPGLPLMQKSFGPQWTERFMQQCFFL